MSILRVAPGHSFQGELRVPGDKSISHRAAILGALADGETTVKGFLQAQDTLNTVRALAAMGVEFEDDGIDTLLLRGAGLRGLRPPNGPLDLGNSGTGMRLLMGVLAGQGFEATLVGDASLSRRPMDRIAQPLRQMGITVQGQGDACNPPVTVLGGDLKPVTHHSPVASAQVKSAVLLAGLYARGTTTVVEPARSRDHTERMLAAFGARVTVDGLAASVNGDARLSGRPVAVPGDFSSAAFFICLGLLAQDSKVTVRDVLLNPTRVGLLTVLGRMGARLTITNERDEAGETIGDIAAETSDLQGTEVGGDELPALIDEVPLLAVVAARAQGTTIIRDAGELRVKESDRLSSTIRGLRAMGATVDERADGMTISGPCEFDGAHIFAEHDHRIAMSFAVAGLLARTGTSIAGAEYVATSFPGFGDSMRAVGADIREEEN